MSARMGTSASATLAGVRSNADRVVLVGTAGQEATCFHQRRLPKARTSTRAKPCPARGRSRVFNGMVSLNGLCPVLAKLAFVTTCAASADKYRRTGQLEHHGWERLNVLLTLPLDDCGSANDFGDRIAARFTDAGMNPWPR